MGHEYIELHNSATAITCYRQALNISESDFRAWYGLGQTYEMLHLYQYASYYFKKAAVLRPGDARMWSAVGNCLLKLGSRDEAIGVFERAVLCGDSEGISTRELAKLCR
jgi:anaphase-promoting complex subunit 8